jgi:Glycosyl-4,4'-diaponeurosporenoate acyltransferase
MGKKILFVAFSVGLVNRSYALMSLLLSASPGSHDLVSLIANAFAVNLFLTGIFAFPGFVFPTHKAIGSAYYKIQNPDSVMRIYRALGVRFFRAALMIAFWGRKTNRLKYFDGTRGGIENLIYQSKQSEFGHLGAFVSVLIASSVLFFIGHLLLAAVATIFNVLGNLYPLILQRHHRARINRLLARRAL